MQSTLLSLAVIAGLSAASAAEAGVLQARAAVAERAQSLLASAPAALRRASGDAFVARDVIVDADGTEHVRFDRTYNGLPVIGGDTVVQVRNGRLGTISQTLRSAARPALKPQVSADQAIVEAGARFGSQFQGAPSARLVVYALNTTPTLAYEVVFNGIKADQTPTEMHYIVDARSGRVLNQWDGIHVTRPGGGQAVPAGAFAGGIQAARPGGGSSGCAGTAATGTGRTILAGNVTLTTTRCSATSFELRDTTRGGGQTNNMAMKTAGMGTVFTDTDNIWGNNLTTDAQSAAADAHYGVALTWDFYKNIFGRLGIANNGVGAVSRVHYGRNYANAFWSDACFCMTFGDGDNGATIYPLVSIDVAAHEMTHGVTSRTADLIYSGESGGLNEATSDIFGTMVEYYANDPADPADYVIGEQLFPNNANMRKAIRWMFKPSLDGSSPDCYYSGIGSLDVHYSSGVANHFFYLLAEGAVVPAGFGPGSWANLTPASLVCNGNTGLTGIGRSAAQQIWYRALTVYMTSGTNYAAARTATLNAAADLYGNGSPQYNAVAAAWSAVNVN
ncbi:M4 family metallopeptidase [Thermomonas flagellata]|uniref:M4 family metallopeptidase n=1 Tax=Thermomonas flagellata TaxID=2888524 RepID=UPI003CE508DF